MKLQVTKSDGGALRLSGALDIYAAGALREILLQQIESTPAVELDLSAVDACDVIALQLLCAARKSAVGAGKRFSVVSPSSAVAEAGVVLGFDLQTISEPQHA